MKRRIIGILWIAILSCQVTAHASTGIYISLQTGWANQAGIPTQSAAGATGLDHRNIPVGRFGLGYIHDFNPRFGFGFEAANGYYSRSSYHFSNGTTTSLKSSTTEFLAVFIWHFQQYDLFANVGALRHAADTKKATGDVKNVRIQPQVGIGMNYNFTRHCAFTAGYSRTFGQKISNLNNSGWTAPSLNEILAGIRINFN